MDTNSTPQHTFGGRAFDRYVTDFEADISGDDGSPALDVGDPDPAGEPAAETSAAPDVSAAPAAALDPQVLREVMLDAFEELLADDEPATQRPAPPELPEFDPFKPESVQAHVNAAVSALLEQQLGPIKGLLGTFAEERGEAEANKFLEALERPEDQGGVGGGFDRQQTIAQAAWMVSQGVPPDQALRKAAADNKAYNTRIGEQAIAAREAERAAALAAMNGNPADPAAAGAGSEITPVPTGPDRYRIAARASIARQGLGAGVTVPTG